MLYAGLFMALQPKIIACGQRVATFSMAVRFLTGPAVMAATSIAIGLRGVLLHVAIVQVRKKYVARSSLKSFNSSTVTRIVPNLICKLKCRRLYLKE